MKINGISNSNYQNGFYQRTINFQRENVKKENGYIMIPEKKYKRDKLIEYGCVAGLILIEIIRCFFNNKPNFPKL